MTKTHKPLKQKVLITIARILGTGVFICTILLLLVLAIPRFMGYQTFNVVSGSMEPEINVGSLILVKEIDPLELKEGDVVAFYSLGEPICHRVVRNNTFEGKITTKGDANESEDFFVTEYDNIIGIVKHHISTFGMIGGYISTVSGKLLVVELLAVAALLHIIANKLDS